MTVPAVHLVNGALLVTEDQNQALLDAVAESGDRVGEMLADAIDTAEAQGLRGVPIAVVPANGQPTDVGRGKRAFVGADGAIYVADTTQIANVRMGMLALLRGGQA